MHKIKCVTKSFDLLTTHVFILNLMIFLSRISESFVNQSQTMLTNIIQELKSTFIFDKII